jgi:hypothetical protein
MSLERHDARSHERHDARSHVTMHGHMNFTMHGHMNVKIVIAIKCLFAVLIRIFRFTFSVVFRTFLSTPHDEYLSNFI